jgi:putative Mn2+ efflux pump MntP
MTLAETLLIAIGLAMDAFAVSLGASASNRSMGPRAGFRLSFHFGLFQCLMPIAGWLAGNGLSRSSAALDHWLAFGLLSFVGLRMIRAGFGNPEATRGPNPSRGMTLVMLSVATSVDALAVGFSLALLGLDIWYPAVVIGLVTAGLALVGVHLGRRVSAAVGRPMEIVGGVLLIAIGARILIDHLST